MTQPGTLVTTYTITDVYDRADVERRTARRIGFFEQGQLALVVGTDKSVDGTWYCIITSHELLGWVLAHWCEVVL